MTNLLRFGPRSGADGCRSVAVHVDAAVDRSIVVRMINEVRQIFRYIVGGWKVTVQAIDRGRWRLELSGTTGRHVWMFAAPAPTLPVIVVEKLQSFLRESAAAYRPLPI